MNLSVFNNLIKRGVQGEILELIWNMNNNARARIKESSIQHSDEFIVEESLKQGVGLSAITWKKDFLNFFSILCRPKWGK